MSYPENQTFLLLNSHKRMGLPIESKHESNLADYYNKEHNIFHTLPRYMCLVLLTILSFITVRYAPFQNYKKISTTLVHDYSKMNRSVRKWWGHFDEGLLAKNSGLLYVSIPKSGSSTMKCNLQTESLHLDKMNTSDFHTLTFWRHPMDRLVSAYSTMMSSPNYNGLFGICHGREMFAPRFPRKQDLKLWESHFQLTMKMWVDYVWVYGFENPNCKWNEHIVPQVEYIKTYDMKEIHCIDKMKDVLLEHDIIMGAICNSYEHTDKMPSKKFGTSQLLLKDTREKIHNIYDKDYEIYDKVC